MSAISYVYAMCEGRFWWWMLCVSFYSDIDKQVGRPRTAVAPVRARPSAPDTHLLVPNCCGHGRKEGRNWVLRRFQQLRSYRDEIETQNREEIPYSSRIVLRGLSVAEGPQTVPNNAAHL